MKNLIALLSLFILSMPAMAEETHNTINASQWMCVGYGIINTGGPAGPMTFPFQGKGDSEFEAMNNALQNCRSQGLQQCMISSCYNR